MNQVGGDVIGPAWNASSKSVYLGRPLLFRPLPQCHRKPFLFTAFKAAACCHSEPLRRMSF